MIQGCAAPAWAALAVLLSLAPAAAATRLPAFEPGETAMVARVVDGAELVLADGRTLRLAGIAAPRAGAAAEVRRGRSTEALDARARAALEKLVAGREVELRYAGNRRDRHDRILAQLFLGKRWIQGELLRRGLARVEGSADNRLGLEAMLRREASARAARRGLWRDPAYAVRAPEAAGRYAGSYQLVEGVVLDIGHAGGTFFLHLAERGQGLSLRLAPEAARLFRSEGVDPADLRGQRIRVRGWISGRERPVIEVTFPEQIERL